MTTPALGLDRLKVAEWMLTVVRTHDGTFSAGLDAVGFPRLLLGLMREYSMNCLYHNCVLNIFSAALGSGVDALVDSVLCDRSVR